MFFVENKLETNQTKEGVRKQIWKKCQQFYENRKQKICEIVVGNGIPN